MRLAHVGRKRPADCPEIDQRLIPEFQFGK
jgi:hypothetical protein